MKLRELSAQFTKYGTRIETWQRLKPGIDPLRGNWTDADWEDFTGPREYFAPVDTLAEADGIWFECPKCFSTDGHSVRVGFAGKATPGSYGCNKAGQPVLWNIIGGSTIDDLQLAPSILLEGGCNWHGFIGSSGVPPGEAA